MDDLLKILVADEKKLTVMMLRHTELKKNIKSETNADKETRIHLGEHIAAIKKTNSVIVSHYLDERRLSPTEISKITNARLEAQN